MSTTVKLALYKGKGQIGNAFIRAWTGSIYSHCEIVVGNIGYSSSVMDGGVRAKEIDFHDGKWDLIDIPWVSAEAVEAYFKETDHFHYGYLGLIGTQMLNMNRAPKGESFCSQWCAVILGFPNPATYSPLTIMDMALHEYKLRYGTPFVLAVAA